MGPERAEGIFLATRGKGRPGPEEGMTARKPPAEVVLEAKGRGRGHRCPGPVGNKGRRGRGSLQHVVQLRPGTRAATRAAALATSDQGLQGPSGPNAAARASRSSTLSLKPPMGPARRSHLAPLPRCPGQTPVSAWVLPPPGPGRPSLPSDGSPPVPTNHPPGFVFSRRHCLFYLLSVLPCLFLVT